MESLEDGTRRFVNASSTIWPVADPFPRLTRRSVPMGVTEARYQVDLDQHGSATVSFQELITSVQKDSVWS